MGNSYSQQHKKESRHYNSKHNDINKLSATLSSPTPLTDTIGLNSAPTITPPLSTKSSSLLKSNSRPNSVMGDVRASMQKMMLTSRSSSTLDVTSIIESADSVGFYTKHPPRRSFSTPIDLFSDKTNNDDTIHTKVDGRLFQTLNNKYCLPIDEEEQDRLTNTVRNTTFVFIF